MLQDAVVVPEAFSDHSFGFVESHFVDALQDVRERVKYPVGVDIVFGLTLFLMLFLVHSLEKGLHKTNEDVYVLLQIFQSLYS